MPAVPAVSAEGLVEHQGPPAGTGGAGGARLAAASMPECQSGDERRRASRGTRARRHGGVGGTGAVGFFSYGGFYDQLSSVESEVPAARACGGDGGLAQGGGCSLPSRREFDRYHDSGNQATGGAGGGGGQGGQNQPGWNNQVDLEILVGLGTGGPTGPDVGVPTATGGAGGDADGGGVYVNNAATTSVSLTIEGGSVIASNASIAGAGGSGGVSQGYQPDLDAVAGAAGGSGRQRVRGWP